MGKGIHDPNDPLLFSCMLGFLGCEMCLFPKLFCALYCRAWATALLGLGLRIFQEQLGLALKLLGPTIAPQNPAYPTSWLERRVLVNPGLQYGLFNSALY